MAAISSRDLKSRIRSLQATRQITKAMELVSSARLRQAQAKLQASRPCWEALSHALSPAREYGRTLYIVIAGDRGLAGGYNSNVLKLASSLTEGREAEILPVGKKATEHFRIPGAPLSSVGDCLRLGQQLAGEYDTIYIVYTVFNSVLTQTPAVKQLLPVDLKSLPIEQDAETAWKAILPGYLGGCIYGALCESRCSEQAARRTAMDAASSNADSMIDSLRRQYNRARQAAITQELTEIVAGASR